MREALWLDVLSRCEVGGGAWLHANTLLSVWSCRCRPRFTNTFPHHFFLQPQELLWKLSFPSLSVLHLITSWAGLLPVTSWIYGWTGLSPEYHWHWHWHTFQPLFSTASSLEIFIFPHQSPWRKPVILAQRHSSRWSTLKYCSHWKYIKCKPSTITNSTVQ